MTLESRALHFNLTGRNAIVTGGSTGIGREVVRNLSLFGANVVFNSTEKSRDAAESLVKQVRDESCFDALWVAGDITSQATIEKLVTSTKDRFGNPDILVCCAGITRDGAFLKQTDEDFERVYDIKVTSARRLTQTVLRDMSKSRWGRIVYIGSVAADGSAWQVNYAMANSALEGLAKSVSEAYASRGIAVNVIKPALVDSKLTRPPVLKEAPRQKIIDQMPLGRVMKPEEIADVALMLIAQKAPIITGHSLYADGGMRRI